MSTMFWVADQHHGHSNILNYCNRPYNSLEEMDEALIDNYNSVVTDKDIVYFLGDFSFYDFDKTTEIFKRYNGHKHILYGNHCRKYRQLYSKLFESTSDLKTINYEKKHITMCHYPLRSWLGSHRKFWHLAGHSHNTITEENKELISQGLYRWDCGVDTNGYFPISFDELKELFK